MKKFLPILFLLLLSLLKLDLSAQAPSFLNGKLRFNGEVNTQVPNGNLMYVGGSFTAINALQGPVFTCDTIGYTTTLSDVFPKISGEVNSIVTDGAGGYYLGGTFNYLNGTQLNLLRVNASGTVILQSVPPGSILLNSTAKINKLIYHNGKIWILATGGVFRLNIGTNQVENISFGMSSTDIAYDGEIVGIKLYVGGKFNTLVGQRPLIRIDLLSGLREIGFYPTITSSSNSSGSNIATIYALAYSNNTLYFGGTGISYVNGQLRKNMGAISTANGGVSPFSVGVTGNVYALEVSGGNLFVGGLFNAYYNTPTGGSPIQKSNLLSVNLSAGQVYPSWSPNPNSGISTLKAYSGKLLVGGNFNSISGNSLKKVALFTNASATSNPILQTAFAFNPDNTVTAIELVNNRLMIGGTFSEIEYLKRNRIAAFNIQTGLPAAFAPSINNGTVHAIAFTGQTVCIGGSFSMVEGQNRSNFVNFTTYNTGSLNNSIQVNLNNTVRSIAINSNSIFIGGDFTTATAQGVQLNSPYLVRLSFSTNPLTLDPTFNASLLRHSAVTSKVVNVVKFINGELFVGGSFIAPRNNLAKLSPVNGSVIANFDARILATPNIDCGVNDIIPVGTDKIAIGGKFSGFNQTVYNPNGNVNFGLPNTLAVLQSTTGNLVSSNANYSGSGIVSQMVMQTGSNSIQYVSSYLISSYNIVSGGSSNTILTTMWNNILSMNRLNTLTFSGGNYWFGGGFAATNAGNYYMNLGMLSYTPPGAPTIAASGLTLVNRSYNSMSIGWTNGNGQRRLVLARASNSAMGQPVNGNTYSANSAYAMGQNIGGAYVVYDGTGNSVSINNLNPQTQYNFRVIEYNGSSINTMYDPNFLPGAFATLDFPTPTYPGANMNFSNVTTSSMYVNWSTGNGSNRILVCKQGAPVDFVPSNNIAYNYSTNFGDMPLGNGNFCVGRYNTSRQVFGLQPGLNYHFAVFEYNENGTYISYLTNPVLRGNQTTVGMATAPMAPGTNMTFQNLSSTSTRVSWTNGNGNKRMLVALQFNINPVASFPMMTASASNGLVYTANSNYSSFSPMPSYMNLVSNIPGGGSIILQGKVVYNGSGNTVDVSGLSPNTYYSYFLIEYNELSGLPNSAAYLPTPLLQNCQLTDLGIQPPSSSAVFPASVENQNTIRLTWANGNGNNRLVVARQGLPVSWQPAFNTSYAANSNFTQGIDLGSGQKIVYSGNGSSVDVSSLLPYTIYHFAVYEYNAIYNAGTQTTEFAYRVINPAVYNVRTSPPNWPRVAGGSDADAASSVGVDGSGNVYVTGIVRGSSSFGLNTLNSNGVDIFIAKYNALGDQLWVKNTGGTNDQVATSIVVTSNGEFYLAGSYKGSSTFDNFNVTAVGGEDGFLTKYNTNGIAQWVRTFGGDSQEMVNALAMDGAGNILLTGIFAGVSNFSGSSTVLTSNGKRDVLVAKYASNGNLIWAKGGGSPANDFGFGIGSDQNNNVYVAGEIQGASSFGTLNAAYSGQSDAILLKYDANGNEQYVNKYGNTGDDRALYLDVDGNGNVYMVGQFSGITAFGSTNLTSAGITDGYLVKITGANGTVQWAKQMGGVAQDIASAVDIGSSGEIFVTGTFGAAANFDSQVLTSAGNLDVFVANYTGTGLLDVAKRFGGQLDDAARGICAFTPSNTYITGYFNGAASYNGFDVYTKVAPVPPNSNWDAFIHNIGYSYNSDPSADLVAWYRLNNNANDFSGNNLNGTIVSSVLPNVVSNIADRNLTPTSAMSFAGTGRISFDINGLSNYNSLNEMTVMAWVKLNSFAPPFNTERMILTSDSGSGMSFNLQVTRDQALLGQFFDNNGNQVGMVATQNYVFPSSTWTHVALTYQNGVQTNMILNSNVVRSQSMFATGPVNLDMKKYHIGVNGRTAPGNIFSGSDYLNGSLDDIRIYKTALSPTQIATIMASASSVSAPPMENGNKMGRIENVLLWPNPSNGQVNLQMVNEEEQEISFRIIDLSGATVYKEATSHFENGMINKTFDLVDLPAGFYTLQIIKGNDVANHKLILNK